VYESLTDSERVAMPARITMPKAGPSYKPVSRKP